MSDITVCNARLLGVLCCGHVLGGWGRYHVIRPGKFSKRVMAIEDVAGRLACSRITMRIEGIFCTVQGWEDAIILRKVLKPQLITVLAGVVAVGIVLVGYVFNLVL